MQNEKGSTDSCDQYCDDTSDLQDLGHYIDQVAGNQDSESTLCTWVCDHVMTSQDGYTAAEEEIGRLFCPELPGIGFCP